MLYSFARFSGFFLSAMNYILILSMHDNNGKCTEEQILLAPIIPTFIIDANHFIRLVFLPIIIIN